MKNIKTANLILILVLISLLSNVFAQRKTVHIKTACNKFGTYDNEKDSSIYEVYNDSEVDVYLTKDTFFLVDDEKGIIKLSSIELLDRDTTDNVDYIYLKAIDESDKSNIRNCLFLIGINLKNNLGAIYLTDYKICCYLTITNIKNKHDYTIENLVASLPKYEKALNTKSP